MAKFQFKLQAILNLKHQIEEQTKNLMGKAIQFLDAQKAAYRGIESEREELIAKFGSQSAQGISIKDIRNINNYISALKEKMKKQNQRIVDAKEKVDEVRAELVKIMKEREILEKLREKKYQEHTKEEYKKEQMQADELTNYKYSEVQKVE